MVWKTRAAFAATNCEDPAMKHSLRVLAPLTILALALGVLGCGSDTETVTQTQVSTITDAGTTDTVDRTVTDETTDTEQTTTTTSPAPPADSFPVFISPSGNIGCQMDAKNVRCDIREAEFAEPAAPSNCPLDYGDSVGVRLSGPGFFVCHGDTAVDPGAPQLAYGESTGIGPFVCQSAESGISCTNTDTGNGFTLSRQAADLF